MKPDSYFCIRTAHTSVRICVLLPSFFLREVSIEHHITLTALHATIIFLIIIFLVIRLCWRVYPWPTGPSNNSDTLLHLQSPIIRVCPHTPPSPSLPPSLSLSLCDLIT